MIRIITLCLVFCCLSTYSQQKYTVTPIKIISREADTNVDAEIPLLLRERVTATQSLASPSQGINETQGELSVSLTGGATYNIPIVVPPGINGIEPQISLSYNSQGGNGLAGFGWNVSGISVITRIPSTKFHDNNTDGVDFDLQDRLTGFNDNNGNRSHTYDPSGRITNNTALGDYSYNGSSFQLANIALTATADAWYKDRVAQSVTYNAFKSPVEIID